MTKIQLTTQVYYAKNAGNFLVYYKMRDDSTTELAVSDAKNIRLPNEKLDQVTKVYFTLVMNIIGRI